MESTCILFSLNAAVFKLNANDYIIDPAGRNIFVTSYNIIFYYDNSRFGRIILSRKIYVNGFSTEHCK